MIEPEPGSNPRPFGGIDLLVIGALAGFVFVLVTVAREWTGDLQQRASLHLEASYLPLYALFSLTRGVLAYGLSFAFTMAYGYLMARAAGAERFMLPTLDILQSIPVLGFLPGFVLGLVHLFPRRNIGLELASVLMIFTGQVWNMTFSFYSSLKAVPPDLAAVARLTRMTWWQRFIRLDLSFAANGLLWNSMISMAGGWFFLMVSESFVLGEHDFRLPGLGSYMSLAIERNDTRAEIFGVLAMLGMIVLMDQVVWRPLVAWSHKFTDDEASSAPASWLWDWVRQSRIWRAGTSGWRFLDKRSRRLSRIADYRPTVPRARSTSARSRLKRVLGMMVGGAVLVGVVKYAGLLNTLTRENWNQLLAAALITLARVILAVGLASIWTIPAGVLIGRHPRWSRNLQPVIQIMASFPAPMIFPLVTGLMLTLGAGFGTSSVVLLVLSTQWYILFNVIAGSSAIPKPLWEVSRLSRFTWRQRWWKLILPTVFPSLVTGWITAAGGAWNASIVAEYMQYHGRLLTTPGLGSAISLATERGDFHILAASVGLMALTVVAFNRLVWRPLSLRAQTRFALLT